MLYSLKSINLLKSIGNDIVDLRSVNKSRTEERRFYSKILSAEEQELFHSPQLSQITFFVFVWLLWSIKESGYKYLKRNAPDLVFPPTKIIVKNITYSGEIKPPEHSGLMWENTDYNGGFYNGHASYNDSSFYFKSKIDSEWITSVANEDENFDNVYWGMKTINSNEHAIQSSESRLLLLERLGNLFSGGLTVKKRNTPYLLVFKDDKELEIPVSLSHDGNFIAYAFLRK